MAGYPFRNREPMPAAAKSKMKTATMVGPADQSNRNDASRPRMHPADPNPHPNATRLHVPLTAMSEAMDGTIRKAKTSSTPATFTEKVTMIPKVE
jgi:hypothetical protein